MSFFSSYMLKRDFFSTIVSFEQIEICDFFLMGIPFSFCWLLLSIMIVFTFDSKTYLLHWLWYEFFKVLIFFYSKSGLSYFRGISYFVKIYCFLGISSFKGISSKEVPFFGYDFYNLENILDLVSDISMGWMNRLLIFRL